MKRLRALRANFWFDMEYLRKSSRRFAQIFDCSGSKCTISRAAEGQRKVKMGICFGMLQKRIGFHIKSYSDTPLDLCKDLHSHSVDMWTNCLVPLWFQVCVCFVAFSAFTSGNSLLSVCVCACFVLISLYSTSAPILSVGADGAVITGR